ncbi:MAG: DUF3465 domain-containing protein [Candidatus Omnitrophica bacterium]|nr:DUF3465 domain-containing protein [Candidatus Omnitrophota bacterium]
MTTISGRSFLPGRGIVFVLFGISLFSVWGCELRKDKTPPQRQELSDQEMLPLNPQNDLIKRAFEEKKSDLMVISIGTVVDILPDDTRGVRHQRFVVRLKNRMTLLISHNIDLSDPIKQLKKNDTVMFKGEYEWNAEGGVIHWTHKDPQGEREGGWIEHKGKKYE